MRCRVVSLCIVAKKVSPGNVVHYKQLVMAFELYPDPLSTPSRSVQTLLFKSYSHPRHYALIQTQNTISVSAFEVCGSEFLLYTPLIEHRTRVQMVLHSEL